MSIAVCYEQLRNPIAEVELQQHQQAPRPRMVVTVIPKLLVDGEKLTSGHAVVLLLQSTLFQEGLRYAIRFENLSNVSDVEQTLHS